MSEKTIVIIEDDEMNMELFIANLKKIPNVNVIGESDGIKAVELIKSVNPDLIILDIRLPGMSGTEICKEIRTVSRFKDTPIIAITSFAMKGDKERILRSGFDKYVSKPINIKEFRQLVKDLIE